MFRNNEITILFLLFLEVLFGRNSPTNWLTYILPQVIHNAWFWFIYFILVILMIQGFMRFDRLYSAHEGMSEIKNLVIILILSYSWKLSLGVEEK